MHAPQNKHVLNVVKKIYDKKHGILHVHKLTIGTYVMAKTVLNAVIILLSLNCASKVLFSDPHPKNIFFVYFAGQISQFALSITPTSIIFPRVFLIIRATYRVPHYKTFRITPGPKQPRSQTDKWRVGFFQAPYVHFPP